MGVLKSTEFADDPKLQACAVSDPAHVTPGSIGSHVGKIQNALIKVDGAVIDGTELEQQKYGASVRVFLIRSARRSAGRAAPDPATTQVKMELDET